MKVWHLACYLVVLILHGRWRDDIYVSLAGFLSPELALAIETEAEGYDLVISDFRWADRHTRLVVANLYPEHHHHPTSSTYPVPGRQARRAHSAPNCPIRVPPRICDHTPK